MAWTISDAEPGIHGSAAGSIATDPITDIEWTGAKLTPPCIVEDYLFADVGLISAPGGVGKTTLLLYESVHIALGLPLYGLEIKKPGRVIFLTAEDSRERLVARLRLISQANGLSPHQAERVRDMVRIIDVVGKGLRLTEIDRDVVKTSAFATEVCESVHDLSPVLLVIDPAVSFGVGESRVNDAEQGLVEAARAITRRLGCCVRYVHHTGQEAARRKITDMYAGRGGSAFADGCRMVSVLQSLAPEDWKKETGCHLEPGQEGLILARPKLSYSPPRKEILLVRHGYRFQKVENAPQDRDSVLRRNADHVFEIVLSQFKQGHLHSGNSLENFDTGLSRPKLRAAIHFLLNDGRLEKRDLHGPGRGGMREYLHPFGSPYDVGEATTKSERRVAD